MKLNKMFLVLILFAACLSNATWAFDPRDFHQVMGVDVGKHDGTSDGFDYLVNRFGKAEVIGTGSAASAKNQIFYATQDHSEELNLYNEECGNGYLISALKKGVKLKKGWGVLKESSITVAGISLGMSRAQIEKVMPVGEVEGGYKGKLEKGDIWDGYHYVRKIKFEGNMVDDEIYIHFAFDKNGKLEEFGLDEGGCD